MIASVVATALLALPAALAAAAPLGAGPRSRAPTFAGQYFVEGVFKIPYFDTAEPITAWTDVDGHKQKIEYYGGQDTYLYRYDLPGGKAYEMVPVIDRFGCFETNVTGPAAAGGDALPAVLPLVPNVSSWKYVGAISVNNVDCDQFQFEVTNVTAFGTGRSWYTMEVDSQTREPVRLVMQGINFIMGSHPDIYVFEYHQFRQVQSFDDDVFAVPEMCSESRQMATTELKRRRVAHRLRGIHASLGRVVPPMHTYLDLDACEHDVHPHFHGFTIAHKKRYHSCAEHAQRQAAFLKNKAFVEQWNADASNTHTVELNMHADLSDEEYRAVVLLPRDGDARRNAARKATRAERQPSKADLAAMPRHVDWSKLGALTAITDQGACGSCWAFGSQSALSGAYKIKHGAMVDLSQQQLVDCGWKVDVQGCDGGFAANAYEYLMKQGGVATYVSYPYLAQDGWCNAHNIGSPVKVSAYVNVTGTDQMLEALTHSPVAIAIDASLPSFRFYKHGIYSDPKCRYDLDSLDHEVTAYGYDLDEGYYMVANSWSTHWGDNGVIKMTTDVQTGCGVASQATRPEVV